MRYLIELFLDEVVVDDRENARRLPTTKKASGGQFGMSGRDY